MGRLRRVVGLVVVMALGAGVCPGAEAPAGKIPAGPEARTEKDFMAVVASYFQRNMVEAYATAGTRDDKWNEAATTFLKHAAGFFAGTGKADPEALSVEGKALVEKGCTDPMVLYAYGVALQEAEELEQAAPVLRQALDGVAKSGYPRVFCVTAATRLADIDSETSESEEETPTYQAYRDQAIKYIGEAGGDGSYQQGGQRMFLDWVEGIWDDLLDGHQQDVYEALKANPKTDPYVRDVIGGRYEIAAAWEARGGGWASEVTQEGWAGFKTHLNAARDLLTAAWKLHPEFPEAPTEMITVAMGRADGEAHHEKDWFYRAVAAQMDYQAAYDAMMWDLHPRWSGSYDAMYAFGVECLETRRFDTGVPMMFVVALQSIAEDNDDDLTYWRKPETYSHLKRFYAGYKAQMEETKASEETRNGLESMHAATDYLTRHYEDARVRLAKLGDNVDSDAFESFAGPLDRAIRDIEARTGLGVYASPKKGEAPKEE
jgi:hypothetical protein